MSDKKNLLLLLAIMSGTIALIAAFAFIASGPPKPVNVEVGSAYFRGPKDAKVTVVEFSDFECQSCQVFATQVLPEIESAYRDKIKFVYKFFPLYEVHKLANLSAQSAWCAGKEGKFWEYHDILMKNAPSWKDKPDKFVEYVKTLNLDEEVLKKCKDSNEAKNAVLSDRQQGERLGINSTPSFFVNGEKVEGLKNFEFWKRTLDKKLRQ